MIFIFTILLCLLMTSCTVATIPDTVSKGDSYRNFYEIFVASFYDSNCDGMGDINGIIEKIDYLNDANPQSSTSLGIDGIWLMPIMPSPSYHKYDVVDYYSIDSAYGTMEDFENLITECEKRDISVIIDLVFNHTSSQHPWFISAKESIIIEPCGEDICPYEVLCREHNDFCSYYNFSDSNSNGYHKINDDWYYQGVFYDGMPDLNLDNEKVQSEILRITDFWFKKGVTGFRLDAVTQLFDENISRNVEFLTWFNNEVKKQNPNAYIVAEAWTDGGSIQQYYNSNLDSFFNFAFSESNGKIVTHLRKSNGEQLAKDIVSWNEDIKRQNPNAIDAPFLSNHDNARSAGFLMRDLVNQKMAASIYMLMPGNPFIYYGEEIGMTGSGRDENKRQHMIWSLTDKVGETLSPTDADQIQSLDAGVYEQLEDQNSLLNFYQKIIKIKNKNPEIARGSLSLLDMGNSSICAYSSTYENSTVNIIHNLSNEDIRIELDGLAELTSKELVDSLTADTGEIILKNNVLYLSPYSTAIIK